MSDRSRMFLLAAAAILSAAMGLAGPAAPAAAQSAEKFARLPIRADGPKSLDPAKGSTTYDNQVICQI